MKYVFENNNNDSVKVSKDENGQVVAFEQFKSGRKHERAFSEGKTVDQVVAAYKQFGFEFRGIEV